jgi:hypothetical protein
VRISIFFEAALRYYRFTSPLQLTYAVT